MQTSAYWAEMLAAILISSSLSILATVLVLRNYWSRSKSLRVMRIRVKDLEKGIAALMHHYHHGGISSRGKSTRGLISLSILELKRVIRDSEVFVTPIHPTGSKLITNGVNSAIEYLDTAVEQVKQIEEDNIRPIKNFEHLQK